MLFLFYSKPILSHFFSYVINIAEQKKSIPENWIIWFVLKTGFKILSSKTHEPFTQCGHFALQPAIQKICLWLCSIFLIFTIVLSLSRSFWPFIVVFYLYTNNLCILFYPICLFYEFTVNWNRHIATIHNKINDNKS